eukprot:10469556-Prorocentrum_lima.AAC.1
MVDCEQHGKKAGGLEDNGVEQSTKGNLVVACPLPAVVVEPSLLPPPEVGSFVHFPLDVRAQVSSQVSQWPEDEKGVAADHLAMKLPLYAGCLQGFDGELGLSQQGEEGDEQVPGSKGGGHAGHVHEGANQALGFKGDGRQGALIGCVAGELASGTKKKKAKQKGRAANKKEDDPQGPHPLQGANIE